MENALQDVTDMMQAGAMLLFKTLLYYIIIPEFVAVIFFGFVLRIRGFLFRISMIAVTIVCFYLFWQYGMPNLTEAATKITTGY